MKKIAIVTDSNSGITQALAKELGIYVIPMPFTISNEEYFEDVNLTQEKFYEMLLNDVNISTSQPSVGTILELWDKLLTEYDEIVHIPMSSGLSQSLQTAKFLARDYEDKVFVVDNQRISVTLKRSVLDALTLVKAGKTGKEIREILEATKLNSSIYIMVDTLKYLKRGGRVTAAGAALGTILKIKPVLQIQGEKLDAFAKSRGVKSAKRIMVDQVLKDIKDRFTFDGRTDNIRVDIAYTKDYEAAALFKEEIKDNFECDIEIAVLPLSISCHIGPGALAITATKIIDL